MSDAVVDRLLDRVLAGDLRVLETIAAELEWPTQHDRVVAAARGLYRRLTDYRRRHTSNSGT
jgi:hypothetical protein